MTSPDEKLLALLREKAPDVTEREAILFEHLWRLFPHIPPNLMNLTTGESTAKLINDWLEETYDLRFRLQKREPKPKRKKVS